MKNRGLLILAATSALLFSCGNGGAENSSSKQELSSEESVSSIENSSSEAISSEEIASSEEEIVSIESSDILVESSEEVAIETSEQQISEIIEFSEKVEESQYEESSTKESIESVEDPILSSDEIIVETSFESEVISDVELESSEEILEESIEESYSSQEEFIESSEELVLSSEDEKASTEEGVSLDDRVKTFSLTAENIPETSQSAYNLDFDFESNGYSFHGDRMQRGHGEYDGTIQFSSATRGAGFFYNRESLKGTVSFNVQKKESTYGNFTGVPTIYGGSEENPLETILPTMVSEGSKLTTYEFEFDGYFTIFNNSEYMMAVTEFVFELE